MVLSWLAKITAVLGLVALVAFDGLAVASTTASVADQGSMAAREASEVWDATKNIQLAYNAAVASATEANPGNVVPTKGFSVDTDGTVHLVIRRESDTLLIHRWTRTAGWGMVEHEARGRSVS